MTNLETLQLADFDSAKALSFTIEKGFYKRPSATSNYCGYQSMEGKFYVIGDTDNDIQNPDAIVNGKPAREVNEFCVIMHN